MLFAHSNYIKDCDILLPHPRSFALKPAPRVRLLPAPRLPPTPSVSQRHTALPPPAIAAGSALESAAEQGAIAVTRVVFILYTLVVTRVVCVYIHTMDICFKYTHVQQERKKDEFYYKY